MKKIVAFIFLLTTLISSCKPSAADIQNAIAQTQAAYTPTPTAEEAYCHNFTEAISELSDFKNAMTDWATFLNSPTGVGNDTGTWGSFISLAVGAGPLVGQGMINSPDPALRDGTKEFVELSRDLANTGTKLQIKLNAVTPPQSLKLSHENIMSCFEPAVNGTSQLVDFFEKGERVEFPSFEACSSLKIHLQEISNICK